MPFPVHPTFLICHVQASMLEIMKMASEMAVDAGQSLDCITVQPSRPIALDLGQFSSHRTRNCQVDRQDYRHGRIESP